MKLPLWLQKRQKWLYISLLSALAAALLFLSLPNTGQFKYEYRLGQVWLDETVVAPVDFVLPKSDEQMQADRERLFQHRDFIYTYHNRKAHWLGQLSKVMDSAQALELATNWQRQGVIASHPGRAHLTFLEDFTYLELNSALTPELIRRQNSLPDTLVLLPSYVLNETLTDSVLEVKLSSLSRNRGTVAQGTPLVLQGTTIGPESYALLAALESHLDGSREGLDRRGQLGALLYLILAFMALAAYLSFAEKSLLNHSSSLNLYYFTFTGLALLTLTFAALPVLNIFAVPLLLFPVIIRSFFNARLALAGHLFLLVMTAPFVPNSTAFIAVQFAAGLSTMLNLEGIYKRSQLFQSTLRILLSLVLVHLAFHLMKQNPWQWSSAAPLLGSFAGTLVLFFVFPLIYFFERIFGVVSDLTLLELSDMNNPLLKKLSKEAPGTFQHTMQVANLAEHATELVGGNTLLARTGALYHDIGKTVNPFYFTENSTSGTSPHDDLSYIESAEVIIRHVADGIDLARRHKLPDVIVDFIRTHHGTSRVEYFYRKYKAGHPDEDQFDQFRYPGPKPFSKETAILMMADAVEAATRSLPEKNQEALNDMIEKIVQHQLSTGQMDNADITLKEIVTIKEAFKKFIRGVYHVRIEYPEDRS